MIKDEILASLLQSHDPSEIILIFCFAVQKTFIIIIIIIIIIININMLKTAEHFFSGFFDEWKFQKKSIYLK